MYTVSCQCPATVWKSEKGMKKGVTICFVGMHKKAWWCTVMCIQLYESASSVMHDLACITCLYNKLCLLFCCSFYIDWNTNR